MTNFTLPVTKRANPGLVIFRKSLARGRISLLSFGFGMFLFEFITAVSYPAIGGSGNVRQIFQTLGPDMQRLLKIAPNLQVGFGPANYLAFGYFHPVFLGLGSAFVVSRASDAIAGDVERGTILFVLSRPVARLQLLFGKALETVVSLLGVMTGAVLGTVTGTTITNLGEPINVWSFVIVGLNAYFLLLALGGVSLVISALSSSASKVAGIATAFALLAFVADFLSVLPFVSWLDIISPFRYYDPQKIVANGGEVPWLALLVLGLTAGLGFFISLSIFQHRDIAG